MGDRRRKKTRACIYLKFLHSIKIVGALFQRHKIASRDWLGLHNSTPQLLYSRSSLTTTTVETKCIRRVIHACMRKLEPLSFAAEPPGLVPLSLDMANAFRPQSRV